MSEPFLSEIKLMSFGFPPRGWALCNGQFLPINQNQALFSLLGTTYGGNGQTTFALPDLRGRVPIHMGGSNTLGERGGEEAHTLSSTEMPTHVHAQTGTSANATTPVPSGTVTFARAATQLYAAGGTQAAMSSAIVGSAGGSQPHENRQPFLTLSFCIALQGIFPSQN